MKLIGPPTVSRARWLMVFVALLCASCATPVLAEDSPVASEEAQISPEGAPPPEDVQPPGDEAMPEEVVAVEDEELAREAWLESPAAIREREESRTAFDDLPTADAEGVLSSVFQEALKQLDGDPARILSDLHIEEVVSENGALVSDGEGGSELVESPIPIRSQVAGEESKPLDLTLEESEAGGFESKTPSIDLQLPKSLAGQVEVGEELGISSLPGDDDVSGTRFGDKDLFFANADADTDTLVAPLARGVEVFEQLRSPKSPEQFRYELSLPKGTTLRPDGQGGAEIVDSDGKRVAFVPTPFATDAQGTNMPVSMTVEGDSILVSTAHRSMDIAYPALLDPELVVENWYWNGGNTFGLGYWGWEETADYENSTGCIVTCWGSGLYARSKGSKYLYGANTWGRWVYSAPNSTAYINRAVFSTLRGSVNNCQTNQPHGWVGLWNGSSYSGLGTYSPLSFSASSFDTGSVGGTGTRWVHVAIGTAGSSSQLACGHDFYVGGATIYQDDPENPGVSVSGMPGGWITDTPTFTITSNGSDPGLGVRKTTFTRDGQPTIERSVGCNGTAANRCPTSRTEQFNVSGLSFDEGKKNAYMTVEDVTGKKSTKTWQTYVDRTKPDVTLSGQLAVATDEDEGEEKDPEKWDELSLPVYNLTIKATDIGTESNADYKKRSGVRKVEVLLDGIKKQEWTQPCSDSCSMEKAYSLKLNGLSADKHVLKVIATDGVEKKREREIEFEYIPATGIKDEYVMQYFPLPDGSGNEAEEENPSRPELAVNVMNGNLVYREKDIDIEGYSIDLEVERYYNSLLPEAENTEWGDGWTLAQTPDLKPEETEGSEPPAKATMVRASGAVEGSVALPASVGTQKFDPQLQAVVTKESGGGYEIADATGETDTAVAFNDEGKVDELRTEGLAKVDYSYENGTLSGIAVDDPASTNLSPDEFEAEEETEPEYQTSFGSAGTGNGQFDHPADVALTAGGQLLVADAENDRVQRFDEDGQYIGQFGSTGDGEGQFEHPVALAVAPGGDIIVADTLSDRIQRFNSSGNYLATLAWWGEGPGEFRNAEGIAVEPGGDLWVSDNINDRVQKLSPQGDFIEAIGTSGPGQLDGPRGIDIGPDGEVVVADEENERVVVFSSDGEYLESFEVQGEPSGLDVDAKGDIWVAEKINEWVERFHIGGGFLGRFGSEGEGEGEFELEHPTGVESDSEGRIWVTDSENNRVQEWRSSDWEATDYQDDPMVQVETVGGLVSSVEGAEAGKHVYAHGGGRLGSHVDADGETDYEYDAAGRMTWVGLPNGTWASIEYVETDGRVKNVTVDPAGSAPPKTTTFVYTDQPRSTKVILPNAPAITYDIGEDGSVFKWQNALKPPEFEDVAGTLYDIENKETATPIAVGEYNLVVQAYSDEGIASIQVYANGNQLISEKTCPQIDEEPEACKKLADEWVTYTGNHAPGILNLEMVIEDGIEQVASKRFWVNIPYTPPAPPGEPVKPTFADVLEFREEHGLDVDLNPVKDELEINDRVFDTINDWVQGKPVAVSSMERWGAPLRTPEVAELEYRLAYWKQAMAALPAWIASHAASAFAGFYLDERAGGKIKVGFTGGNEAQKALVDSLIASGAVSASDRIVALSDPPQYALAELKSLAGQVQTTINSFPSNIASRAFVNVHENGVTAVASNVPEAESRLESAYGAGAPISVISGEPLQARGDRNRINNPMLAGDRIWMKEPTGEEWGCSAAFGAYDYDTKPATGQQVLRMFFLTAGHCGEEVPGTTSFRTAVPENPGPNQRQKLGTVKRSGWDASNANVDLDIEAVRYEAVHGIEPRRIFNPVEGAAPIPVTGVGTVGIGTRVCYSGATTDENHPFGGKCGTVFEFSPYTIEEEHPPYVVHLLEGWCFDRRTEEGDSGGPVWIEGTGIAVGLVSVGDNESTCFASLLPDAEHPTTPGVLTDGRLSPLDGLTLQP